MKLGIVVSEWYWDEITSHMLDLALEAAEHEHVKTEVVRVPGCYDTPLAVKQLLKKKSIDAVITLGAIVQGATDHDRAIAYSIFPALTKLSLEFNKPVFLGITGPRMTMAQAIKRIPKAKLVMEACIEMLKNK